MQKRRTEGAQLIPKAAGPPPFIAPAQVSGAGLTSEPPGLEAGQAYRSRPHPDALAAKEPLAYSDPDRLWLRAEYRFRLCELAVCGLLTTRFWP